MHGPVMRALLTSLVLFSLPALAVERRFGATPSTQVTAPGARAFTVDTAPRLLRVGQYFRLDNRAALELGVARKLHTALVLAIDAEATGGQRALFSSARNAWKYQLLDDTRPVSLALEGEVGVGARGVDGGVRLMLERRFSQLLLAASWEAAAVTHRTRAYDPDFRHAASVGAAYFVHERFTTGIEAVHDALYARGYQGSAFYLGPAVSYGARAFWLSLSFTPQVAAFLPPARTGPLELRAHERFVARLAFGASLADPAR